MHNITFISTMHKEIGKCNADELCYILEKESPNVIFLEALNNTYSNYEKNIFSSFGIYHQKLEIKAIQKYCHISPIEYVPVLNSGLSELFGNKCNIISKNIQFQKLLDDYNSLAGELGFSFLNSVESIKLQKKLRMFEYSILNNNNLNDRVNEDIDAYENSMLQNIYSYCKNNQFEKAVFMCGVAHRHSIIEKIGSFNSKEKMDLNWIVFGN